jgi:transcriptional regulator with XRE-family HTH domain
MNVASMIVSAREQAGLSQAELARRVGMPRSVINVYEHGKRQPGADVLVRLLAATGHQMVSAPVVSPVDPSRAGRILEQVLELAEALPFSASRDNDYPPFTAAVGS